MFEPLSPCFPTGGRYRGLLATMWLARLRGVDETSGRNMKPVLALLLPLALVQAARAQTAGDDADTFFELQVRPVLATRCFKCHGGEKTSSGLRVDWQRRA